MNLHALRRGSVVLIAFPFTDLTATKLRPALVLSSPAFHRRHRDFILAAVSSVLERGRGFPTSVVLADGSAEFAGSGLRVSSAIHCGKLVTVRDTLVLKRLGELGAAAMRRVDDALRRAVGPAGGG